MSILVKAKNRHKPTNHGGETLNVENSCVAPKQDFMSIHNHSEFSSTRFMDSTIKTESLIDRAIELGYKGIALTDHECLSGHVRFLQHYLELRREDKLPSDFKIALGNEIYLIDDILDVTENYVPKTTKFWHFILIAKDAIGYRQLRHISSLSAWKNSFRHGKMERVPTIKNELEDIVGDEKGHLIASSACLGGELPTLCTAYYEATDQAEKKAIKHKIHTFIMWCIQVFGKEDFYIELQPASLSGSEQSQRQAFANQCILKVAKAYGLKWTVTTDSHYLKKEHRLIHEYYLKSDADNGDNREVGDFYETTYMMSVDELRGMLSNHLCEEDVDEALKNSVDIHEKIQVYDLYHSVIVPRDPHTPEFELSHLFKDWYDKCPYIKQFAYSADIQERYFLSLVEQGFKAKHEPMDKLHVDRINTEMMEMWLISEKLGNRIANYYTLVRTIIHEVMWKVSYVGVARGSVTGYYTAYLTGITQISPLPYGLPHWRHLTAERPELPD